MTMNQLKMPTFLQEEEEELLFLLCLAQSRKKEKLSCRDADGDRPLHTASLCGPTGISSNDKMLLQIADHHILTDAESIIPE